MAFCWPLLSQKLAICPLLIRNWPEIFKNLHEKRAENSEKLAICPLSAHFYFQKWPGWNRCAPRVCGFSGHFPTFSLHLNAKKNIKNYIKWRKKVANWPAREFWRVSGGYLWFWSRSLVEPSKFLFQNGWRCAILAIRHSFIYLLAYGENALAKGVFSLTRYARRLIWDCVATMERYAFARVRLSMGRTLLFCPKEG